METPIAQRSFAELTEDIVAGTPGHGGGVGAALTTALAASMIVRVSRASRDTWQDADGAAGEASALRAQAVDLADADVIAFARASEALKESPDVEERPPLGLLLDRAADVPLRIAATAADVAQLAAVAARHGAPDLRADAAAAAALAEGAVRAAALLVEVNLATSADDSRVVQARQRLASATGAREAASDLLS